MSNINEFSNTNFGFGPIRVPDGVFHHVGSIKREDGRILKVMRLLDPVDGPIYIEDPMDHLFYIDEVKIQPMKSPVGLNFYMNYNFGNDKCKV